MAIIAIFIALMAVIQVLSQIVYSVWPLPVVPTLLHVPVIIGSILLGPKKGAILGFSMGCMTMLNATLLTTPLSFVFSPLQPLPGTHTGSLFALVVSLVPRTLIGVFPYFIYKILPTRIGIGVAAFVGTATNTILVLSFMVLFFGKTIGMTFSTLLGIILTGNSLAEVCLAVIFTMSIVPAVQNYQRTHKK